jgi:hypothetical protein
MRDEHKKAKYRPVTPNRNLTKKIDKRQNNIILITWNFPYKLAFFAAI